MSHETGETIFNLLSVINFFFTFMELKPTRSDLWQSHLITFLIQLVYNVSPSPANLFG